jgi:hypothetical protein
MCRPLSYVTELLQFVDREASPLPFDVERKTVEQAPWESSVHAEDVSPDSVFILGAQVPLLDDEMRNPVVRKDPGDCVLVRGRAQFGPQEGKDHLVFGCWPESPQASPPSALSLPPEQPCDDDAEELARRALALLAGGPVQVVHDGTNGCG